MPETDTNVLIQLPVLLIPTAAVPVNLLAPFPRTNVLNVVLMLTVLAEMETNLMPVM